MADTNTFTIITSLILSGLLASIITIFFSNQQSERDASRQATIDFCNQFSNLIHKTRDFGLAFYSRNGSEISDIDKLDIVYYQTRLENTYYILVGRGLAQTDLVQEFGDLLTLDDFDDLERLSLPLKCQQITRTSGSLLSNLDLFKTGVS